MFVKPLKLRLKVCTLITLIDLNAQQCREEAKLQKLGHCPNTYGPDRICTDTVVTQACHAG